MLHGWDNASVISFRPGQTATFVCFTVLHNKLTAWLGKLLLPLLQLLSLPLLPQLLLINAHLYLVVHKALCENEHDVTAVIRQWGHREPGTYMWLCPVPLPHSLLFLPVPFALSIPLSPPLSLFPFLNIYLVFTFIYLCLTKDTFVSTDSVG